MDGEHIEMIVGGWSSTSLRESALSELASMREELASLRQNEKIITMLKERILLAEKKKGEYDTLEMDAFWDGQMRCAQDLLNKVSRLTKRAPDARSVAQKGKSKSKGSAKPARG